MAFIAGVTQRINKDRRTAACWSCGATGSGRARLPVLAVLTVDAVDAIPCGSKRGDHFVDLVNRVDLNRLGASYICWHVFILTAV
jgi:hypothetical protein